MRRSHRGTGRARSTCRRPGVARGSRAGAPCRAHRDRALPESFASSDVCSRGTRTHEAVDGSKRDVDPRRAGGRARRRPRTPPCRARTRPARSPSRPVRPAADRPSPRPGGSRRGTPCGCGPPTRRRVRRRWRVGVAPFATRDRRPRSAASAACPRRRAAATTGRRRSSSGRAGSPSKSTITQPVSAAQRLTEVESPWTRIAGPGSATCASCSSRAARRRARSPVERGAVELGPHGVVPACGSPRGGRTPRPIASCSSAIVRRAARPLPRSRRRPGRDRRTSDALARAGEQVAQRGERQCPAVGRRRPGTAATSRGRARRRATRRAPARRRCVAGGGERLGDLDVGVRPVEQAAENLQQQSLVEHDRRVGSARTPSGRARYDALDRARRRARGRPSVRCRAWRRTPLRASPPMSTCTEHGVVVLRNVRPSPLGTCTDDEVVAHPVGRAPRVDSSSAQLGAQRAARHDLDMVGVSPPAYHRWRGMWVGERLGGSDADQCSSVGELEPVEAVRRRA